MLVKIPSTEAICLRFLLVFLMLLRFSYSSYMEHSERKKVVDARRGRRNVKLFYDIQ